MSNEDLCYDDRADDESRSWKTTAAVVLMTAIVGCGIGYSIGRYDGAAKQAMQDAAEIRRLRKIARNSDAHAESLLSRLEQLTVESLPPEESAEAADGEVASGAVGASNPDDLHNDPRWHAFRRAWIKDHPVCQWKGCPCGGKGMNVHHCWPVRWVQMAGRPELAWTRECGQDFLTLCREHHELAHNIGHGGAWTKFNPDAVHDAKVGRWNSRGKSEWFTDDSNPRGKTAETKAVEWIKEKIAQTEGDCQ